MGISMLTGQCVLKGRGLKRSEDYKDALDADEPFNSSRVVVGCSRWHDFRESFWPLPFLSFDRSASRPVRLLSIDAGSMPHVRVWTNRSMASSWKRILFFEILTHSIRRSCAHLRMVPLETFRMVAASLGCSNRF
jgi:hypothetical protein